MPIDFASEHTLMDSSGFRKRQLQAHRRKRQLWANGGLEAATCMDSEEVDQKEATMGQWRISRKRQLWTQRRFSRKHKYEE